jgi:hypothetical protein
MHNTCGVTNSKAVLIDNKADGLVCNRGRGVSYNIFVI